MEPDSGREAQTNQANTPFREMHHKRYKQAHQSEQESRKQESDTWRQKRGQTGPLNN